MKSFKEFIDAYNDGSITQDAAWRAYNIEAMADISHSLAGLRLTGYQSDGRRKLDTLVYTPVAQAYGLESGERARWLLGLWYVHRAISNGDFDRGRAIQRDMQAA